MNVLDFNSYRRPELVITMKDDSATTIHVPTPTEQLVREFRANLDNLLLVLQKHDAEASRMVYDLAAKLINCNLDNITVTGDTLAKKYMLNLEDMAVFHTKYADFLEEIEKGKN